MQSSMKFDCFVPECRCNGDGVGLIKFLLMEKFRMMGGVNTFGIRCGGGSLWLAGGRHRNPSLRRAPPRCRR